MLTPSIFSNDLFNDLFFDFDDRRPARKLYSPSNGLMKTDVKETEDSFELTVDLPGYDKENIQAQLRDGYLTINATTGSESEEKDAGGRFIRKERYQGSCSRSFYVGEELTQEDIRARFENGTLVVDIPKKEAKPAVNETKYIQIS